MSIDVKVPSLPESVADATVVNWHKKAGDAVKRDEALVEVETDKVVLEVPAPADGVLEEIVEQEGSTVVANQLLARINSTSAGSSVTTAQKDSHTAEDKQVEAIITPSANKLIVENKLDASQITGSGRDGRVLKEDVLQYLQERDNKPQPQPQPQVSANTKPMAEAPVIESVVGERNERRVPMTRLRARIAERLVEAQQTAAILTTFNEVNMQPVMDLRKKYQDKFEKEYGIKLGFMSFFVKAAIEALKRFPAVNASIDGNDIVYHGYFDIGVAVSSPRGLVVPVVRDADQLNLAEIEKVIADFVEKAKNNNLAMEDITGGTFTLSNGGVFGSLLSTPILNPPQSGILGMHKIQQRPVVEDGAIVARPMMYLALSYDHRIIDGREAVQFLVALKDCIEDPARMIIGV
ncbi:MAG: 2-oxoglutarate dehydrogenase complex dihydrolipoyllysine-residue succinyltransferase [Gammaproteobacteria bacterium]|nr:MAG: 2-oxoglutarate dehydrogenase complex dihydrolipoyllysine-residue succinyltransferase [Gammaproteobacteria bacterium]